MCIILTCEKNVRPDRDTITTCFLNNPDGAGIMWVEDGKVQTSKGFMEEAELISAIESVPIESPLVIHMRIATSGGIDVGTCHPFPVCKDLDALHAANVECTAAVAHNGVILGVPTDDKKGISDTVYFVSHAILDMWRKDNKVTKGMKHRLSKLAPSNRFAIMTEDGSVFRIGKGWESVSRGIEASNSTWRWARYKKYTYDWKSLNYTWDDGDYEYLWEDGSCSSYWDSGSFYDKFEYEDVVGVEPDSDYVELLKSICRDCEGVHYCSRNGALCDDVKAEIEFQLYGVDYYPTLLGQ